MYAHLSALSCPTGTNMQLPLWKDLHSAVSFCLKKQKTHPTFKQFDLTAEPSFLVDKYIS